ncbi:MAG: GNAT family N-acetyltransferase [Promicromonosporaceae bacterium]|nr:GNAT family N-acetyltransferase [Promicromonosporaceae bacterium]
MSAVARPVADSALLGERVRLRPMRAEDAAVLNEIVRAPEVARWWDATDFTVDEGEAFTILIGEEVAGWIGWHEETDPDYRHGGLDVFLAPEFHGRGLGREALILAARWLFTERGHHRLTIDPAVANSRAIATYESIGFQPVGVMRRYERAADGTWHDGLLMDLLAEELVSE